MCRDLSLHTVVTIDALVTTVTIDALVTTVTIDALVTTVTIDALVTTVTIDYSQAVYMTVNLFSRVRRPIYLTTTLLTMVRVNKYE